MTTEVTAPMSGKIIALLCKVGDQVQCEDELMVLEALKMENPIFASVDGKISEIRTSIGASVESNQVLLLID